MRQHCYRERLLLYLLRTYASVWRYSVLLLLYVYVHVCTCPSQPPQCFFFYTCVLRVHRRRYRERLPVHTNTVFIVRSCPSDQQRIIVRFYVCTCLSWKPPFYILRSRPSVVFTTVYTWLSSSSRAARFHHRPCHLIR